MSQTNCVFCKIVKREIAAHIVYEDENFMAFLDIHPQSPGHAQVIPKEHFRWVWDMPANLIGEYFKVVQKIAKAESKAFDTDFILSKTVGDEVEHAHVWVFPNSKVKGESMDFSANAEKIKKFI